MESNPRATLSDNEVAAGHYGHMDTPDRRHYEPAALRSDAVHWPSACYGWGACA